MGGLDPDLGWQDIDAGRAAGLRPQLLLCLLLIVTRRWHGRFTNDSRRGAEVPHLPTPRIGGLALALAYCCSAGAAAGVAAGLGADRARRRCRRLLAGLAEDLTGGVGVRFRLLATMGAGVRSRC